MSDARDVVTTDLVVDHRTDRGPIRALHCAPLRVAGGASVAIMGQSGSGKSTLLGLLGALAIPTQGAITIGDDVVSDLAERERIRFRRRSIGMVYQADNLLPHLTVEENVGLQLAITREDRESERAFDVDELLERLGLAGLARRMPDQLSGGERQRVAVARAVVHRPALILADEPTGSLDATNATTVIELLVEVHRTMGSTLIVVTHDPAIAAHLERTVHLERASAPTVSHAG
jgi:putative ABC transport system ATP-binding protein